MSKQFESFQSDSFREWIENEARNEEREARWESENSYYNSLNIEEEENGDV